MSIIPNIFSFLSLSAGPLTASLACLFLEPASLA